MSGEGILGSERFGWHKNSGCQQAHGIAGWVAYQQDAILLVEAAASGAQALGDLCQFLAVGQHDGEVAQANGIGWRRLCAQAVPGVESEVVMIAASGDEGGASAIVGHD